MNKLSSRVALSSAIALLNGEKVENGFSTAEIIEKLETMISALDKKASSSANKPTATQLENEGFKLEILMVLSSGEHLTATEIGKRSDSLANLSNQRISAILRALGLEGKVDKEKVKGKTLFFSI